MQTITLAGRIGGDAKRGETRGGDTVANFNVAVDSRNGREKLTTWWRCALWGKRAEALGQYLTKGTAVALTGEFSLSEYEGKPQLNCRVAEITLLGGGQEGGRAQSASHDRQQSRERASNRFATDDLDDDIAF